MNIWLVSGQIIVLAVRVALGFGLLSVAAWHSRSSALLFAAGETPVIPAAIAAASALLGLLFLMSGWFLRLLAAGRSWRGRFLSMVFFTAVLAAAAAAGLSVFYPSVDAVRDAPELRNQDLQLAALTFAVLYGLCFVIPGLAYSPFRRAEKEEAANYYRPRPQHGGIGLVNFEEDENWGLWRSLAQLPLLVLIGAAVYGLAWAPRDWVTSALILDLADRFWMAVAGGVAVLSWLAFAGFRSISLALWLGPPGARKVVLLAAISGASFYAVGPALRAGLPSLAQLAVAAVPVDAQLTYLGPEQNIWRPTCHPASRLSWPNAAGLEVPICGLADEDRAKAKPGDGIILSGAQSVLGLRFASLRLADTP